MVRAEDSMLCTANLDCLAEAEIILPRPAGLPSAVPLLPPFLHPSVIVASLGARCLREGLYLLGLPLPLFTELLGATSSEPM